MGNLGEDLMKQGPALDQVPSESKGKKKKKSKGNPKTGHLSKSYLQGEQTKLREELSW